MKKIRLYPQQQQHVNLRSVGRSSRTRFLQLDGSLESSLSFGLSILSDVMDFTANVNFNSEESERVSELKNVSGSGKLPYGTLALGAEGIKDAINSFDDAYV